MNTRHLALVFSLLVAGCSVNHGTAGLLYFQKDTLGIDIAAGEPSASPLHINLGYSAQRGTYVPVAIKPPLTPLVATTVAGKKELGLNATRTENSTADTDVFSIFSSFEVSGNAETTKVGVQMGNIFATGFAARALAHVQAAQACGEIAKALPGAETDEEKKRILLESIQRFCGMKY